MTMSEPASVGAGLQVRPVASEEFEEFLDWFARYWQELETFNDFPDPFSREQYRRLLHEPGGRHFWWAERAGRRIGFCVFIVGPHWYRQDITDGYVDEFYIVPEARRDGAGRALAEAMLAEFRRHGVREIRLSVLRRNSRAAAFWSSLGFAVEMTRMALVGNRE
ncbi:MAG TPA: GNAT family N-acetyltransferase [Dehalococcoidia bacterium]|nr:GNAT family N-acetyltransferase [Dehalococcoidia bacterium]